MPLFVFVLDNQTEHLETWLSTTPYYKIALLLSFYSPRTQDDQKLQLLLLLVDLTSL